MMDGLHICAAAVIAPPYAGAVQCQCAMAALIRADGMCETSAKLSVELDGAGAWARLPPGARGVANHLYRKLRRNAPRR